MFRFRNLTRTGSLPQAVHFTLPGRFNSGKALPFQLLGLKPGRSGSMARHPGESLFENFCFDKSPLVVSCCMPAAPVHSNLTRPLSAVKLGILVAGAAHQN